ncbi:MAG: FlgD immunoglobulin-like domain containing protein, partial [Candidatus Cloacimonadaceae bacterium]|nr:FlgD immunoglobulin-like domain containing protein [Candidatus Cloacimonadaceae bacterium]
VVHQGYSDGWVTSEEITAEYNAQGLVTCIYYEGIHPVTQEWVTIGRLRMEYRDDGRPLHGIFDSDTNGTWEEYAEIDYLYTDNRLVAIYYNAVDAGITEPYFQVLFTYAPNTFILEKVIELYFFNGLVPHIKKYEYIWDSGMRPSEITSYVMSNFDEWSLTGRNTYVYHNDDQTSHAVYMRQLEFGWPFYTRFVTGIQPSMLIENRQYEEFPPASGTWNERIRRFYQYDQGRLDTVETLENSSQMGWFVSYRTDYAYNGNLPVSETRMRYDYPQAVLLPDMRINMGYTEITANEDPLSPPMISSLGSHPNPFTASAAISFKLETPGRTEISIFNIKGQKVRSLMNVDKAVGDHQVIWDGKDDTGSKLANGIYLIRLSSGNETRTVKAVLAK